MRSSCNLLQVVLRARLLSYYYPKQLHEAVTHHGKGCMFQDMGILSILLNLWVVLIVSFVVMFYQLGIYATLAGYLSMLIFVPIQVYMGKLVFYIRWVIGLYEINWKASKHLSP